MYVITIGVYVTLPIGAWINLVNDDREPLVGGLEHVESTDIQFATSYKSLSNMLKYPNNKRQWSPWLVIF